MSNKEPIAMPAWMREKTFVIEYSPNLYRGKYLVRLCGYAKGMIDKKQPHQSGDAMGYGESATEAAEQALAKLAEQKANFKP